MFVHLTRGPEHSSLRTGYDERATPPRPFQLYSLPPGCSYWQCIGPRLARPSQPDAPFQTPSLARTATTKINPDPAKRDEEFTPGKSPPQRSEPWGVFPSRNSRPTAISVSVNLVISLSIHIMYQNVCMSVENLSIWKGIPIFRLVYYIYYYIFIRK